MTSKIAIIQQHVPHYQLPFFLKLKEICDSRGQSLTVFCNNLPSRHIKTDYPDWFQFVGIRHIGKSTWQTAFKRTKDADLVIVEQAVKHLLLYPLLARRLFTGQKLALWGHGKNFQAKHQNTLAEIWKRIVSKNVHWWFAYNRLSAHVVENLGYPHDRITLVMNAIDTHALRESKAGVSAETLVGIRKQLGIESENVTIYTGGLYSEKRIPFLLDAARCIRKLLPDFHLIVIGSGSDSWRVQQASCEWIHFLGPKNDEEKLPYWMISKLLLMPGAVDLGVLDSFALGVPMVTTSVANHGPEIDYLKNGINGIIVPDTDYPEAYAEAVVFLLRNETFR